MNFVCIVFELGDKMLTLSSMENHIVQCNLKVFTIYGHGSHLGHVSWTIYINFCSPFPKRLHMKFDIDWPSGFRGDV